MNYKIKTRNATHYCADVYLILPIFSSATGSRYAGDFEESISIIYKDGHSETLNNVRSWQIFA